MSIPHPNQCQWLGPRVGPLEKSVLIVPRHVAAIPEGRSGSRLPAVLSFLMFCQNPSSCPSADATSQPLSLWPSHLFSFLFLLLLFTSPRINWIPGSVSGSITFQSAHRGGIFSVLIICPSRIAVIKVQTQSARSGPSGLSVPVSSSGPHQCQRTDKLSVAPPPPPAPPPQCVRSSFIVKLPSLSRCRQTFSRAPPVCPLQFHPQNVTVVKVQTNFQSGPSSLSVAVSSSKRYRCQGANKLSVGAPPVCPLQFHRQNVIVVKVQTNFQSGPSSLSVPISLLDNRRCQGADKLSAGPLQSVSSNFIVQPSSLSRCRRKFH